MKIRQSDSSMFYSETTLAQPTTQLFKIHAANQIALADRGVAEAEVKSSENDIALAVHQLYYALLVADKEQAAAEAALRAAQENRIADLTSELNDLLGLPSDAVLEVSEAGLPVLAELAKGQAYDQARAGNGELLAARKTLEKSDHTVRAAKQEYIPDLTTFAKHGYQYGAPFLDDNVGMVGAELSWKIFDGGKRKGEVGQRLAQRSQA